MQNYQIMSGFSDIKSEFLKKTRTSKSMDELTLWFTFEDEFLCAHDYSDHDTLLVIASVTARKWTVYLKKGSYGERLVLSLTSSTLIEKLEEEFNHQYKLHGFGRFDL